MRMLAEHVLELPSKGAGKCCNGLTEHVLKLLGRSQRLPRDGRTETAAAQQAGLDFLSGLKCPYT